MFYSPTALGGVFAHNQGKAVARSCVSLLRVLVLGGFVVTARGDPTTDEGSYSLYTWVGCGLQKDLLWAPWCGFEP